MDPKLLAEIEICVVQLTELLVRPAGEYSPAVRRILRQLVTVVLTDYAPTLINKPDN